MKNIFFLLFFLLAAFSLKAQSGGPNIGSPGDKGKITGVVTDSVTRQPVDYATVSVYKQGNTSPFNGASTDPKGNFTVDGIQPGDYKITVDFLGYKRRTIAHVIIGSGNKNIALGTILLAPTQNQLKEVSVTASAPTVENKIDKLVYNPGNDLTVQGGVALDVLKKVPMVSVDIDGNVELMGNSNIQFLINGKPSTIFGASFADALQSIPSDQIKSIEVITNPGAKYDATGTAGIINIVLKDNKVQGVNGSINLTAGTRLENGSFNLNARKGNFGVSAFFGGREQLNSTTLTTNNNTSVDSSNNTTRLLQNGQGAVKRSGYRSGLNFNWSITPKDELTASIGFNHFGNSSSGFLNQDQAKFSPTNSLLTDTMSVNNSSSRFNAYATDASLAYKKTFKKENQELDILYDYSYSNNNSYYMQQLDYTNVVSPSTGSIGNNPGNDKETNVSVDYTQPVTKDFTIETGAKAVIENLNNTVNTQTLTNGAYIFNPTQSYSFNYKRNIFAYYLSGSFTLFNDFIDGKAGLREEYTTTSSDFPNTTIPSYGILAPSFVLSHKLDKKQSIKFSYSYRLERPDYGSLNPFYNISDPHNISTGNPDLKPELGHNYELGYNNALGKGANIYIAAFYRYNTDDLQSFTTFHDSLKIGNSTYNNVYLNQRYNIGREVDEGINLYGSVPVTDRLSLRSNAFFADRTTTNPGSAQVSGFIYRINLNSSYDFGNNFAGEFFVNYRSSQTTIQGNRPAFYFYDIAFRKQLLNKKLSIGLTTSNVFSEYVDQRSTTFGPNFNQSSLRQIQLRSFGINLMYKFGKLEFKKEKEQPDNNTPVPDDTSGGGNK